MKFIMIIIVSLFSSIVFADSLTMTLDGPNFPAYMIVGGPSASVTYLISNTLGGPLDISLAEVDKTLLPKESTIVFEPGTGTCGNLQNNQTCKLKITLNPIDAGAVQDIVQTGPKLNLNFNPFSIPVYPPQNQKITVRVFPNS